MFTSDFAESGVQGARLQAEPIEAAKQAKMLSEIHGDVAIRIAPTSLDAAREMIEEVRGLAPIEAIAARRKATWTRSPPLSWPCRISPACPTAAPRRPRSIPRWPGIRDAASSPSPRWSPSASSGCAWGLPL